MCDQGQLYLVFLGTAKDCIQPVDPDYVNRFPSAWAADPLNNWLGRRGTIFVTGLL